MSSSGRRETVLVFCVSAVKELYMSPVRHYCPDSVHVFLNDRDDELTRIETEMFAGCRDEIGCDSVILHRLDTSDYNAVLGELISVKNGLAEQYGEYLDIYLNISSGTHEFSAAAMFASMLPRPCIAFRVTNEYALDSGRMHEVVELLNSSSGVTMPTVVTKLQNESPDEEIAVFLTIVADLLEETRYPRFRTIIDELKNRGYWSYDPGRKSGFGKTSLEDREERYLKRHYLATALENGWMTRESTRMMKLTEKGRAYLSVYRKDRRAENQVLCDIADDIDAFEMASPSRDFSKRDAVCRSVAYDMDLDDIPSCRSLVNECPALPDDEGGKNEESNSISVKSGGKTYRITLNLE